MKTYVVCLLFDEDFKEVVLINKQRPQWQAGRLNGVGGQIEAGETQLQAAIREFKEETGMYFDNWHGILTQKSKSEEYKVHYMAGSTRKTLAGSVKTITDEAVQLIQVKDIGLAHIQLIEPLSWVIPLSVYCLKGDMPDDEQCTIKY